MRVEELADVLRAAARTEVVHTGTPPVTALPAIVVEPGDPWIEPTMRGHVESADLVLIVARWETGPAIGALRDLYLDALDAARTGGVSLGPCGVPSQLSLGGVDYLGATVPVTLPPECHPPNPEA